MLASHASVQPLERRCLLAHDPGIDGFGVLGDSYCDEYAFYAPDRSTARNWVEQLAEDSNVSFGTFSDVDPPGPRNEGFEFNWAVSGATSTDMIVGGQHTGVAAQAATGAVDLASIFIGGNDFRAIFVILATQGPGPAQAALQAAVPTLLTNIGTAAGTILSPPVVAANPDIRLILTTIPKLSFLPELRAALLQNPQIQPFVDAVDQAVVFVNQQLHSLFGANPRIAIADFAGMIDAIFAAKKFKVGNVTVNRAAINNPTNDPRIFALADRIHPGTIAQGLLANLFAQTANDEFGTRLRTLSTHDILQNAGLKKHNARSPLVSGRAVFSTSSISNSVADELFRTE